MLFLFSSQRPHIKIVKSQDLCPKTMASLWISSWEWTSVGSGLVASGVEWMERTGTATAAAARYNLVPYCRALTAERPSQPLCHAHSVPTGWLGLTSSARFRRRRHLRKHTGRDFVLADRSSFFFGERNSSSALEREISGFQKLGVKVWRNQTVKATSYRIMCGGLSVESDDSGTAQTIL